MKYFESIINQDDCLDYSKIKDRLFINLYPLYGDAEKLDNLIHETYLGLHAICNIIQSFDGSTLKLIPITKELAKTWLGVTKGDIVRDSIINSASIFPPVIINADDIFELETRNDHTMFMVTNEAYIYGASVMFYPSGLLRVAEKVGSEFYIIPSAIHEFMVVPDTCGMREEDLKEMLIEINGNADVISRTDILSNQIFHYSSYCFLFETAAEYEKRIRVSR